VEIADISADNRGKGQKISLILVDEDGAAAADSNAAEAGADSETAPADAAPANS
jgi:polyribonucleotide nucleotidyltransferase